MRIIDSNVAQRLVRQRRFVVDRRYTAGSAVPLKGGGTMHAHSVLLLDEYGQPLSARWQSVLLPLAPRLQRQFPALNDDCTLTEVLEEAGRRMAAREERKGPLENPQAYAWVVARRMAALR